MVASARSVTAVITGSASLTAEAAHSWADTGNELFLVVANRRSARAPDRLHPHGREAYVWPLLAALGLFVAGGAVSIIHGVNELRAPTPADHFVAGYVVLAIYFVLEGRRFCGRPSRPCPRPRRCTGTSLSTSWPRRPARC